MSYQDLVLGEARGSLQRRTYPGSCRDNKAPFQRGSITATANASGAIVSTMSYGPFGEPNVNTGVALRYTGQMLDPDSGLYYYKARWYSPYLGRFLSPDPALLVDGLQTYTYVGNDPISFTDPFGLNKEDDKLCSRDTGAAAKLVGGYVSAGGDAITLVGLGIAATGIGAEVGLPIAAIGKGTSAIGTGASAIGNYCSGNTAGLIGDAAGLLAGGATKNLIGKINKWPLKNPFTDKFIQSYNGGSKPQFTPNPFSGPYRDVKQEAAGMGAQKAVSGTIEAIGNFFKW